MSAVIARERLNPLEMGTLVVGFLLVGIAIAVTTVSYALNMTFQYQWLVWVITAAFGAVALITLAWHLRWRFADLQHGAAGRDAVFGDCTERLSSEDQRCPFWRADRHDRLHGRGQSLVRFSLAGVRLILANNGGAPATWRTSSRDSI